MLDESDRSSPPPTSAPRKLNPIQRAYEERAKSIIRKMMRDRDVDVEELSRRLGNLGIRISPGGIANKISRGGFSAAFFLQCTEALSGDAADAEEADKLSSGF